MNTRLFLICCTVAAMSLYSCNNAGNGKGLKKGMETKSSSPANPADPADPASRLKKFVKIGIIFLT